MENHSTREEKVQGILLSAIPYLGNSRILKVFTGEFGLISLIYKGSKKIPPACLTPFCAAEWVFQKGKEEIHRLKDATLLDDFSALKTDFSVLTAAGAIARDLLRSQLPFKKGDGLYALLSSYFKKLPSFSHPETLAASFRIKLLLWEGLLSLAEVCSVCCEQAHALSSGESFCTVHASSKASIAFQLNEWKTLFTLAFARQFSILEKIEAPPVLHQKIEQLFEERMR